MLGLFGRKKKISPKVDFFKTIIKLDDSEFINTALKLFEFDEPQGGAMCAIAYRNQMIHVKVYKKKLLNFSLNSYLNEVLLDALNTSNINEIGTRRILWFIYAVLLMRATFIAEEREEFSDSVADIWVSVIKGCKYLKTTVDNNVLWQEDEKTWWTHIKSEQDGMADCINFSAPEWIAKHPKIQALAKENNISIYALGLLARPDNSRNIKTILSTAEPRLTDAERAKRDRAVRKFLKPREDK